MYRARDMRLEREVALKILPRDFAHDVDRRRRFEREARLLASLNHPAIAVLYGLEDTDGVLCLVMEVVEGATLLCLQQGPFRVSEALALARQIADGLEAAHERGVLHRDLKPSNIKVTPEGRVKLLDFGLAQALRPEAPREESVERSTTTDDTTGKGAALGTAPYMSPEQARGEVLDRRTDVWAFGCVLYEMLSGHRAFLGPTHAEAIAAVLEREPNWNALPAATPPVIRKLLRRCLEKDKARRLHDIGDARLDIEEAQVELSSGSGAAAAAAPVSTSGRSETPSEPRARVRRAVATLGALLLGLLVAFWAGRRSGPMGTSGTRDASPVVTRSVIELPAAAALGLGTAEIGSDSTLVALSPDGRWLVYVGESDGVARLYRRALDRFDEPQPIAGTEGAVHAFFSPDSHHVGFLTHDKVKRISIDGDDLRTLCPAQAPCEGTWTRHDMISFADDEGRALRWVSTSGGGVETFESPDLLDRSIHFGQALPDGKTVLLTERTTGVSGDYDVIHLLDIRSRQSKVLIQSGYDPRYIAPGHLIFARGGNLMAVGFDPVRGEVSGEPAPVLRGVAMHSIFGHAQVAFSAAGPVAYVPGSDRAIGRLARVDRQGRVELLPAPPECYGQLSLSPDGARLAVHVADMTDYVWIWDLRRNEGRRVTGPSPAGWPIWSPSGEGVAFTSWEPASTPAGSIQTQPVEGRQRPRTLRSGALLPRVYSWAGTKVSVRERLHGRVRTGLLSTAGTAPVEWDETPCYLGALSRDGHWIACFREQQIRIRSLADPTFERQVSTDRGYEPRWCGACNLLFFRKGKRWLATAVSFDPELRWEPPKVAFQTDFLDTSGLSYDVSPDGRYLYVVKSAAPDERRKVHLVAGWFEELRRLVPAGRKP